MTGGTPGRRRGTTVRAALLSLAVAASATLASGPAAADMVPNSRTLVGPWAVAAFTRDNSTEFEHCSLFGALPDGLGVMVALSAQGESALTVSASDWDLTPGRGYVASVSLGGGSDYTLSGRSYNSRILVLDAPRDIFRQLRSGVRLTVSVNGKRHGMVLDSIEAASAKMQECVRQYAASAPPPPAPSAPPASPSSGLVAAIQTLLARLGYDPGPANGTVGLKTNIAIAAFQKSRGEAGDGLPSEALRAKLERAVAERSAGVEAQPGAAPLAPATRPNPPSPRPPSQGSGQGPGQASGQRPGPPPGARGDTSGTGFFIGPNTLVTNYHVINGCSTIRVTKNGGDLGAARVVAQSRSDDLAALRTEVPSKATLKLRVGAPIKPAEAVLVFGYPLAGALSSAGNTTLGNVTALTGMADDSRFIQISAAVQPGNSGGAALDESGRVMGVVVSKLDALAVARIIGDIPQNVNFAIKVGTLVSFLEAHNVAYEADSTTRELSNTQRAERAEAGSAQVECRK